MSEDLDLDAVETREWMDALGSVTEFEGTERAGFLVREITEAALAFERTITDLYLPRRK